MTSKYPVATCDSIFPFVIFLLFEATFSVVEAEVEGNDEEEEEEEDEKEEEEDEDEDDDAIFGNLLLLSKHSCTYAIMQFGLFFDLIMPEANNTFESAFESWSVLSESISCNNLQDPIYSFSANSQMNPLQC
jgi:hypothetical protein